MITDKHIKIGCEVHTTATWQKFKRADIERLDGASGADEWAIYGKAIIALAKAHQSQVAKA